jgi:hypothetical protein
MAGAVIGVHGLKEKGSRAEVLGLGGAGGARELHPAAQRQVHVGLRLSLADRHLARGYEAWEVERAWTYFRADLVRE